MILDSEQLDLIEDYSSNFMSWKQIAVLLDLNEEEFRDELLDRSSGAYKRYTKGKTLTTYAIAKSIVKLAKLGSPQAEILVREDINRQSEAENDL